MRTRFEDRTEAGRELAARLTHLRGTNAIVLALPRGGVPVAYEIARALHVPLDVLNVRKLGVPWHEELAMGAIGAGGVRVLNDDVVRETGVTRQEIEAVTRQEEGELDRRERAYRGGRPAPDLAGRTVVLVDDGIATGATIRAAIAVVRAQHPARLVLATPVAQASIAAGLRREVDEVVCALEPAELYAIGLWYDRFGQLDDAEVRALLGSAAATPVLV
jgi:putative phosphoribosyl transferase